MILRNCAAEPEYWLNIYFEQVTIEQLNLFGA